MKTTTDFNFSFRSLLGKDVCDKQMFDNKEECLRDMSLVKSPVTVRSKFSDMFYNTFYYQVRGNKILKYSYSEFRSALQKEQIELINEKKNETYRGEMTEKSARRLKKKIEVWWDGVQQHNNSNDIALIAEHRQFVFLTLTLSSTQIHSDQDIKLRILKPFFRVLRDEYGIRNFIWKAESQKNGNIHFHCVIDRYIAKEAVQLLWNKCQNNLGYVDEFRKKFNHCHPPSIKIEAVHDKKGLIQYIEKYISKKEGYRKIEGAVWKGSQSVMSLQFFEVVGDSVIEQELINAEDEGKIVRHDEERYTVYTLKGCSIEDVMPYYVLKQQKNYLELLDRFLFSDEVCFDFRDFCFLFSEQTEETILTIPFICKKEYPVPVQLSLFDLKEIFNIKKLREL
jgi:hypothetical protein